MEHEPLRSSGDTDGRDESDESEPWLILPPVPEVLHSAASCAPFRRCILCDADLAGSRRVYQVMKAYRGREVVFELAMCVECGLKLCQEYSEESLDTLMEFSRRIRLRSDADECHACGSPRASFQNFSVCGCCVDDRLMLPVTYLCQKCELSVEERLSRKTRDVYGDFLRDHIPGIPADLDLSPTLVL